MLSVLSHANLANLTKFASLHSRIVLRKHSAKPTAASEAMQPTLRKSATSARGKSV